MDVNWINKWIEKEGYKYQGISRNLWNLAETGMEEMKSAELLCGVLREQGFTVEKKSADIPTAFSGSFGKGKPVIGILGEFDALEGLSQKAGSAVKESCDGMVNGHGCGHNLLGAGSLAAAVALKEYIKENDLSGTVVYYGCPGEEKGCGKVHMAAAGCFDKLDAALTWHPMDYNAVEGRSSLADLSIHFHFTGTSAHAASCPHLGRSALDAVELLNIAANFLREHMIPEARIHYAITDAGGTAPNIVPAKASVLYEVRAPKKQQALELQQRLIRAAQGAAMMTDTDVEIEYSDSYSDFVPNDCLNRVAYEKFLETGGPAFMVEDLEFVKKIRDTFSEHVEGNGISTALEPYAGVGGCLAASTDVGDVSYLVPTSQIYVSCCAVGTPGHSWQMVSQTGHSLGETGMLTAVRVLALTAAELLKKPELLDEMWKEQQKKQL